jgi:tRNA/rRNA methyltransferase
MTAFAPDAGERDSTMPDSIGPGAGEAAAAGARLRFVLVEPSHVGNIGSSARALCSMGFARLVVVRPREPGYRDAPEAVALAAGAGDVLAGSQSAASLEAALDGVQLAIATTGYARELGPDTVEVRAAARRAAIAALDEQAQVAFVFGTERSGLSNADVRRCQLCCSIPADPARGSLNLAQAAQVVAYEVRRELLARASLPDRPPPRRDPQRLDPRAEEPLASVDQAEGMYAHLEAGLVAIGYHDPAQPRGLMARLRRMLARAQMTATDVDVLRGIAAAMVQPRRERVGRKSGE